MENMKAVRIHNCGGPEVLLGGDNPNRSRKVLKKAGILVWIVGVSVSEARNAHELNETGHARGKIVLKVA